MLSYQVTIHAKMANSQRYPFKPLFDKNVEDSLFSLKKCLILIISPLPLKGRCASHFPREKAKKNFRREKTSLKKQIAHLI